ncbi:MAG: ABC transporter permease [Deltaproteobacteria bacterium]|nr:ABC transporter permease [Candidatus Anaeroferrophillacea bacterium]
MNAGFLSGCLAVYRRELLILKSRGLKLPVSMAVSPLLYLVAFGLGVGGGMEVGGRPYREFLLPGLVAMGSMTQAFGIAGEINIARFYWRTFEEFQSSPVSDSAYVLGEILAGMTKAVISVLIIAVLGRLFDVGLHFFSPLFWLGILLNAFFFAAVAVLAAMLVKSHADQAMLFNFIITPMAFLGGTFFPVERMPAAVRWLLELLPLTHAARLIRSGAGGEPGSAVSILLLALLGAGGYGLAWRAVCRARD